MTTRVCPCCEEDRAFRQEARREELSVRGVAMSFSISVEVCEASGEALFDEARDQKMLVEAFAQYRRQKNLLSSQEIKAIRERFALSQKSFASLLGMSEATINRYESGALQEETHDNMIRLASTPEAILSLVERRGQLLSEWQRNRTIEAARSLLAESPLHRRLMPTAIGEFNGGRVFSFDRYSAAAAWFCTRLDGVLKTKMNKLMFYADFLAFKELGCAITGTAYRRLQYGPVPVDFGTLQDGMECEDLIAVDEGAYPNGTEFVILRVGPAAAELGIEFTHDELRVLECVADQFKSDGSKTISDRSHLEDAWVKTPQKGLISFKHAKVLSLGLPKLGESGRSVR